MTNCIPLKLLLRLNSDCGFYVLQNVRCILHPEMGQKKNKKQCIDVQSFV